MFVVFLHCATDNGYSKYHQHLRSVLQPPPDVLQESAHIDNKSSRGTRWPIGVLKGIVESAMSLVRKASSAASEAGILYVCLHPCIAFATLLAAKVTSRRSVSPLSIMGCFDVCNIARRYCRDVVTKCELLSLSAYASEEYRWDIRKNSGRKAWAIRPNFPTNSSISFTVNVWRCVCHVNRKIDKTSSRYFGD